MKMRKKEKIFIAGYVLVPVVVFVLMKLRVDESLLSEQDLQFRYGYMICYVLEGMLMAISVYLSTRISRCTCAVASVLWCLFLGGVFLLKASFFDSILMPIFMDENVTMILFGIYLGSGLMALTGPKASM